MIGHFVRLIGLGAAATAVWYVLFSAFHNAIDWLDERHNR